MTGIVDERADIHRLRSFTKMDKVGGVWDAVEGQAKQMDHLRVSVAGGTELKVCIFITCEGIPDKGGGRARYGRNAASGSSRRAG